MTHLKSIFSFLRIVLPNFLKLISPFCLFSKGDSIGLAQSENITRDLKPCYIIWKLRVLRYSKGYPEIQPDIKHTNIRLNSEEPEE